MPSGEHGVHGNGHMIMQEDNGDEAGELAIDWLGGQAAPPSNRPRLQPLSPGNHSAAWHPAAFP